MPALGVARKHVEARTGRGEHDRVSRARAAERPADCVIHRCGALDGHHVGERLLHAWRRLPDRDDGSCASAERPAQVPEVTTLVSPAQDRDEELFKASFAPSVEVSRIDAEVFKKFRRKVLTNKLTPVPESVQQVSDSEAVVKLRSARGREIPVHVEKVDDKWYITKIDFGKKAIGKFKQQNEKEQPKQ